MSRRPILSVLAVGAIALAACSGSQPLKGIDLPPASLPEEISSDQWAVAFTHEFESGFWTEGPHVYKLVLDCPEANDAQVDSDIAAFAAGSNFPVLDEPIYLRLSGLSTTRLGAPDIDFMSTEQVTTAVVTVIGLTSGQVEAASQCVGEFQYDDGRSVPLTPNEPFRP